MRPKFVKTAITLIIGASLGLTDAFSADWNGSYSVSGQCFCVGELPARVKMSVVPTPVGGQTVAQVCERLGKGPGLARTNGLFNYPVYKDAQCGNGPGLATDMTEQGCSGSYDGLGAVADSCMPKGPPWDIETAWQRPRSQAATRKNIGASAVTPVTVSPSTGFIGKPMATARVRPDDANGPDSVDFPPRGSQWVVIDGKRYIRARADIPAAGGEPGQLIVVDGLVYLLDDGRINPSDLFIEQSDNEVVDRVSGQIRRTSGSAALAADTDTDKAFDAGRASERRAAARRHREDARATSRQIQEQRRRLRQEKLELLRAEQVLDMQELRRAKQQLEAESARRALAVLEARAKVRSVERANLRQAESLVSPSLRSTPESVEGLRAVEPPVAAASPATVVVTHEEAVLEAGSQVAASGVTGEDSGPRQGTDSAVTSVSSALRLPATIRASARNFRYLEALPVRYDVGGDGVMLEGSTSSHTRLQYFGSLGVTRRYNEFMAGAGYYLTPESANRLTFVLLAGIEYGKFELVDGQSPEIGVDYDDSGLYLAASSRMVVSSRFELKAGIGYSSMFEGDAMVFGGSYLHLTRKLDLVTRFELGDNDLLGIGVRYYY